MIGVKKMFVVVITILLFMVAILLIVDGTFLNKKYAKVWSENYFGSLEPIQHKLIAGGLTASSSHNMQPWLVKIVSDHKIELYFDMTKALQVVDQDNTQMLISQGTFIKAYENYANAYGYDAHIHYHEPNFSAEQPLIATIEILKNDTAQKVDAISSSSWMVDEEEVNKDMDTLMMEILKDHDGFSYELMGESRLIVFQNFLLQGMMVESTNQKAMEETIEVFRFTEWEKNQYKYGLTIDASGVFKPAIQSISKLLANDWKQFGDQGIKMFKKRLEKEHTYILIKSHQPTYKTYIQTGQIYQEMINKFSEYAIRPSVQVLEKYDAMKNINNIFQEEYGEGKEVLMIIGIQDRIEDSVRTPRHLVEDILIH